MLILKNGFEICDLDFNFCYFLRLFFGSEKQEMCFNETFIFRLLNFMQQHNNVVFNLIPVLPWKIIQFLFFDFIVIKENYFFIRIEILFTNLVV